MVHIFNSVLRHRAGERHPTVEYIYLKPQILFILLSGYEKPDIAVNCGSMLRECARSESLAKVSLPDALYTSSTRISRALTRAAFSCRHWRPFARKPLDSSRRLIDLFLNITGGALLG